MPALNWLDRTIAPFAPQYALRRVRARAALQRSYDGAARGRRTAGWNTSRTSADAEVGAGLLMLRNRSRDLTRNNPHAKKALAVWTSNLIGTGIMPRAKSGDEMLDKAVNKLFAEWSTRADAAGQLDFAGLQELMVREMVEGGEALIRRRVRADGSTVPLRLEVIEGDLLDETRIMNLGTQGLLINGVQLDSNGDRTSYWLYPVHPGNAALMPTAGLISTPIPADEVLHLYRKERTQVRGVPWCAPVIRGLRDLDDYTDAEIVRKKIEACVTAWVEGPDAADGIAPTPDSSTGVVDANGNPIEQFEPGLIAYLGNGRQVTFNNPGQTAGSYGEYQRVGLHRVAAGYCVPYELLTGELSEVNFSSGRMGLGEFRRLCDAIRWLCLVPMALQPIWDWWCGMAYLAGMLPKQSIPCQWDAPAWEAVNPIDDVNADLIAVRAGFTTMKAVIAERTGRDPDEVIQEIADTNAQADKLGLVLDSDPRKVAKTGVEQPGLVAPPPAAPPPQQRPNLRPVA